MDLYNEAERPSLPFCGRSKPVPEPPPREEAEVVAKVLTKQFSMFTITGKERAPSPTLEEPTEEDDEGYGEETEEGVEAAIAAQQEAQDREAFAVKPTFRNYNSPVALNYNEFYRKPRIYAETTSVTEGFVNKQTKFNGWKRRYCVIYESGRLEYFDGQRSKTPKGSVALLDEFTYDSMVEFEPHTFKEFPTSGGFCLNFLPGTVAAGQRSLRFVVPANELSHWQRVITNLSRNCKANFIAPVPPQLSKRDKMRADNLPRPVLPLQNKPRSFQGPVELEGWLVYVSDNTGLSRLMSSQSRARVYAVLYQRGRLLLYSSEVEGHFKAGFELYDHVQQVPLAVAQAYAVNRDKESFLLFLQERSWHGTIEFEVESKDARGVWVSKINNLPYVAAGTVPLVQWVSLKPSRPMLPHSPFRGQWVAVDLHGARCPRSEAKAWMFRWEVTFRSAQARLEEAEKRVEQTIRDADVYEDEQFYYGSDSETERTGRSFQSTATSGVTSPAASSVTQYDSYSERHSRHRRPKTPSSARSDSSMSSRARSKSRRRQEYTDRGERTHRSRSRPRPRS